MEHVIVSAVQFKPELLDVRRNIATATMLSHAAADKGARVIVLPELCMSGFSLQNLDEAMSVAQVRDGYQTQALRPIATKFNCTIVMGYVELFEGNLYNSAIAIQPNGSITNFQKHNLHGSDNLWATPSESMHVNVPTAAGRLGVLICRDVRNNYRDSYKFYRAEHKFYTRGSADTIALLTNWGSGFSYPDSSWLELSESTGANVIVSNRVGSERDMKYKGGSCCIDKTGYVWTNGSSFTNECVVGGLALL